MKILLLKPDALGDDVLISPVITALKQKFPQSHLAVMAEDQALPIFKNLPEVNEVIHDDLYKKEKSFWSVLKEIRKAKFDLVVNYREEGVYALLTLLSGAPVRVGDQSKVLTGWIYNKGIFLPWHKLWLTHQVIINLILLQNLGIDKQDCSTQMPITAEAKTKAEELFTKYNINKDDFLVGIHPSTGSGNKAYTPKGYAKVAEELIKMFRAKIIIIGSQKDTRLAQTIRDHCPVPIIDLTGKTNLLELAAIIKKLKLYIGVDSGPMHIASALKIPIVFISPSKSQKPERWGPWQSKFMLAREADACPLKQCDPSKCKYSYCIDAINPIQIIEAAGKLLAGN